MGSALKRRSEGGACVCCSAGMRGPVRNRGGVLACGGCTSHSLFCIIRSASIRLASWLPGSCRMSVVHCACASSSSPRTMWSRATASSAFSCDSCCLSASCTATIRGEGGEAEVGWGVSRGREMDVRCASRGREEERRSWRASEGVGARVVGCSWEGEIGVWEGGGQAREARDTRARVRGEGWCGGGVRGGARDTW